MKMNKGKIAWTAALLVTGLPLIATGYFQYQRNHFSCEIHATLVDKDDSVESVIYLTLDGAKGIYEASGDYTQAHQPTLSVSNKIYFSYEWEGQDLIMVSDETNPLPKTQQNFRLNMPDFFFHRERGIRMQVMPANNNSYYFFFENNPVFYCSRR
jgi:hypothetical protein